MGHCKHTGFLKSRQHWALDILSISHSQRKITLLNLKNFHCFHPFVFISDILHELCTRNPYRLVVRLNTSQENTMNRNSLGITALALLVLGTASSSVNA